MDDNEIVIKGLNKFYGKKQVLFDLNLTVKKGCLDF
jgi:ABC-type arginine transport system ATPase subunit